MKIPGGVARAAIVVAAWGATSLAAPRPRARASTTAACPPCAEPAPCPGLSFTCTEAAPPPPAGEVAETVPAPGDPPAAEQTSAEPAPAEATAATEPALPEPEAPTVELRGWTRERAYRGIWRVPERTAGDPYTVPYDRSSLQAQLFLRLRYALGRGFEAVASGLLSYAFFDRTNLIEPGASTTHSRFEPLLREAYVGAFWDKLDLRVGLQRNAWGMGDVYTPNDVLNAQDLRDPILAEREVVNVPTFMVRGDLELGPGRLQVVAAPFFTAHQVDLFGANWALIQPSTARGVRGLANVAGEAVVPGLRDEVQLLVRQTDVPKDDLSATAVGVKYGAQAGEFDLNGYYHWGWTQLPDLQFSPWFAQVLATTPFEEVRPSDLAGVLAQVETQGPPLSSVYRRRHHVGADLATTLESFGLRLDLAYDTRAVFFTDTLETHLRPTAQVVAALEYQTGDVGKVVLIEAWYQHIFDAPPGVALIGYRQDSVAISALLSWTFVEHLELELRPNLRLYPFSFLVRPQVGWKWKSGVTVSVGAFWLDGEQGTYGGFFTRNRTAYATFKYSF